VLVQADGANLTNNSVTNLGDDGVFLDGATGVTLTNTTVRGATDQAFEAVNGGEATATGFDIGPSLAPNTTLGFFGKDASVNIGPSTVPVNPDETNIGRYFNATNTSAGGFLNVSVDYTDSDVSSVTESALRLQRYNGTWVEVPGSSVDEAENQVSANVTNFSTFGVFEAGCGALSPVGGSSNPPTDTTGDGLCNDLNGDTNFDLGHVITFYKNFGSDDTINNNKNFFDFNGDGSITLGDVIELYSRV